MLMTLVSCVTEERVVFIEEDIQMMNNNMGSIYEDVKTIDNNVKALNGKVSKNSVNVELLLKNVPHITIAGKKHLPSEAPREFIGDTKGTMTSPVVRTGSRHGVIQ